MSIFTARRHAITFDTSMVVVAHGVDRGSELAAASEEDDGYSTSTTDDDDDDDDVEPHGPASSGPLGPLRRGGLRRPRPARRLPPRPPPPRAPALALAQRRLFAGAGNEGRCSSAPTCRRSPALGRAAHDGACRGGGSGPRRVRLLLRRRPRRHAAAGRRRRAVQVGLRPTGCLLQRRVPVSLPRLQPGPCRGAASALRWVPHAAAVSAVRALLGASHEDLRLRVHGLSRSLSGAFFAVGAAAAPFASGARFPEGKLFVCADLPPLGPALVAAQRAMMQVAVKDASHGPCDWYFDTVGELMRLLVGDTGVGPAVFDRASFESAFALEWEN